MYVRAARPTINDDSDLETSGASRGVRSLMPDGVARPVVRHLAAAGAVGRVRIELKARATGPAVGDEFDLDAARAAERMWSLMPDRVARPVVHRLAALGAGSRVRAVVGAAAGPAELAVTSRAIARMRGLVPDRVARPVVLLLEEHGGERGEPRDGDQ